MSVTTLGIDLAAESRNTAACRMRWERGRAIVQWVRRGTASQPLDNDALAALILRVRCHGYRRAVRLAAALRRGGRRVG